jgi:hypothetical protein
MKTRFDLEQAIMRVWGTSEDLDALFEQYLDATIAMTEDEMSNAILGIKTLHELRMQQMWRIFEALAGEKKI